MSLSIFGLPNNLPIADYTYELPNGRIAQFPVSPRHNSKLLYYSDSNIEHKNFMDLPNLLPTNALLVFNNTKVIPARLQFETETGAGIEVLVLEPFEHQNIADALVQTESVGYACMVGNKKKWKENQVITLESNGITLVANWKEREANQIIFSWQPKELCFAEVLEKVGAIPLPPYMQRAATQEDQIQYQTIYAKAGGAVAAPTAGLHFTEEVFQGIREKQIEELDLTLHVGAGTFLPVKTENALEHPMHQEQFEVSKAAIQKLLNTEGPFIAVGTTSVRTLESLFWFAVQLKGNPKLLAVNIEQFDPYSTDNIGLTRKEALQTILDWLERNGLDAIIGETKVMIVPGYKFKLVDGLVTNFHQPGSTLMLLVAAFIGADWKKVYDAALSNNYRFLSYGDSSLLIPISLAIE